MKVQFNRIKLNYFPVAPMGHFLNQLTYLCFMRNLTKMTVFQEPIEVVKEETTEHPSSETKDCQ